MTVEEQRAALDAAVGRVEIQADHLCKWWPVEYPEHNGGVLNRVRPCDRDAAFSLLCPPRTLKRVKTMAVELWTLRGNHSRSDRSFILTSDRSVRVLLEKATIIEREVVRLGLDAPHADETCDQVDPLEPHLERVMARLREATADAATTSLGEQLAGIADELSTLTIADRQRTVERLEDLDAEMLQAARAATTADQLQAEADQADRELVAFRGSMPPAAYQRSRNDAIDRLVRERLHLPVLTWDGAGRSADVWPEEGDSEEPMTETRYRKARG